MGLMEIINCWTTWIQSDNKQMNKKEKKKKMIRTNINQNSVIFRGMQGAQVIEKDHPRILLLEGKIEVNFLLIMKRMTRKRILMKKITPLTIISPTTAPVTRKILRITTRTKRKKRS